MQTNLWVKTVNGSFIRADSITVLDVVDGNYRAVAENARGAQADAVFVRALVGLQDGEGLWYHLTARMPSAEAYAALRNLISTLDGASAGSIQSYDSEAATWRSGR